MKTSVSVNRKIRRLIDFVQLHYVVDVCAFPGNRLRIATACSYRQPDGSNTEGTEIEFCAANITAVRCVLGY